ncbi:MAG: hypothetical protein ACSHYB_08695 [Roseibacillus sp.]
MNQIGNFTIPDKLKKLSEPSLDALLEFATSCSEDPDTRTLVVTAAVLSFWQLAGERTAGTFPSLVLINDSTTLQSHAVEAAKRLLTLQSDNTPHVQKEGPFAFGAIEDAPVRMATAVKDYNHSLKLTKGIPGSKTATHYRGDFYAAQRTGYGYGRSRPYASSWDEHFGLISDQDSIVTLRLETDEDITLLKQNLRDKKTLLPPEGFGRPLAMVPKRIALAGSLSVEQWDFVTTSHLLTLGLPIIPLPDISKGTLIDSNWPHLENLATMWPQTQVSQIGPISRYSIKSESDRLYERLRQRLHLLPADYEFAILTLVRELYSMCYSLVGLAASQSPKESFPKIDETIYKLYGETLRGITLGVESLTWHGLGLPASHPPELISKTVQMLREQGPLSLRELQRTARLPSSAARDEILASLVDVGAVRIQDKTATAAPFSEFSARLYGRV